MINFLLSNPLLYRFYQKTVRKRNHEYDFFKFFFKKVNLEKKIRMLDLGCGDSYILEYINEYIEDYLGVDNNEKCLAQCIKKWKKYNFLKLDIEDKKNIESFINFKPNIIFMNGAIHHLNDENVKLVNEFIVNNFSNCLFLSIDPIKDNNNLLNNLMIKFDRGKFIRNKSQYKELMKSFRSFIVDDFYKMKFINIFHFRNVNFENFYWDWKKDISK